jgi:7-cyano-7-deazaguanine tRNA-ribosyltransferase
MLVVAGLSLKNLHPRVWDPSSPFHLPQLRAVMVSYAELHQLRRQRERAMALGLHAFLEVPPDVQVFLDNGSYYFLTRPGEASLEGYAEFVAAAKPDWYPVPRDFIPSPNMTLAEQRDCLVRTMAVNGSFSANGFVPVIHVSQVIDEYIVAARDHAGFAAKSAVALGGIVPNLLRTPKARPYREVLASVRRARTAFVDKELHLFGVGGTATLHLAALLGMDSIDSSGWRNRAARGLVQLPGSGDRLVANLGRWRGRVPNEAEWRRLAACGCPACQRDGTTGLRAEGRAGFDHRATHNLWVLLLEATAVEAHLRDGTYTEWHAGHLDNSIYLPLIRETLHAAEGSLRRYPTDER